MFAAHLDHQREVLNYGISCRFKASVHFEEFPTLSKMVYSNSPWYCTCSTAKYACFGWLFLNFSSYFFISLHPNFLPHLDLMANFPLAPNYKIICQRFVIVKVTPQKSLIYRNALKAAEALPFFSLITEFHK